MAGEVLLRLWHCTLALSAACVLVGILRLPLRRAFGVRAACWLWVVVPLSLIATLLPGPQHSIEALATVQEWAGTGIPAVAPHLKEQLTLSAALLAIWLFGAVVMLCATAIRQRRFLRTLGVLTQQPDGTMRSRLSGSALVVGALRPLLVLPGDFEQRFTPDQQVLILTHERMHLARGDTRLAALGALLVCVFWFNPLVYLALRLLRVDQEMACDAATLAATGVDRHLYATTLLDTQLATQVGIALPAGCHWQPAHPLKKRISMLKNPLPNRTRMVTGIVTAGALGAGTAMALWAAQPATIDSSGVVVLSMNWFAQDPSTGQIVRVSTSNQLVPLGRELVSSFDQTPYSVACTPRALAAAPEQDQWLLQCRFRKDGASLASPELTTSEGGLPTMDWTDPASHVRMYLVVNVSGSPDRIKLAQQQAAAKK